MTEPLTDEELESIRTRAADRLRFEPRSVSVPRLLATIEAREWLVEEKDKAAKRLIDCDDESADGADYYAAWDGLIDAAALTGADYPGGE